MTLVTNYQALTSPGNYDVIPIVDVSDTSQSAAGTTKKITFLDLTAGLGGGGGGGSSAVAWLNVTQSPYSADGSGSTDSTTAIQDAITAVGNNGGGVVYFPPGTYKISAALSVPPNITLAGDGGGGQYYGTPVKIEQTSTSANGIIVPNAWNITIANLAVAGPASGTGQGIVMNYTGDGPSGFNNLEGVYITGFGSNGLYTSDAIMSTYTRVWAVSNGAYGIYVNGGTSMTWTSCWAPSNATGGWYITNVDYCAWNACGADSNTGNGWTLSNVQGSAVSGCGAENNSGTGMALSHCWASAISAFWCTNPNLGMTIDSTCYNMTVTGFLESPLSGASYSLVVSAGAEVILVSPQVTTAMQLPSLTASGFVTTISPNGNTSSVPAGIATRALTLGTPLALGSGGTGGTTAATAIAALVASGIPAVTFTGGYSPAVSNLTFASTVTVNAALANDFRLTLTASTATMGNPANPVNGQQIAFQITQGSGGSFTVAWGSAYDFGAAGAPVLSTTAGKIDMVKFTYNSTKAAWLCNGSQLGF